jgi:hypothetical protein
MAQLVIDKRSMVCGTGETRCAGLKVSSAFVILVLLISSLIASLAAVPAAQGFSLDLTAATENTDLALYKKIVDLNRSGLDYYEAAIATQRIKGYPVRPFVTVRMPTLTWLIAGLSYLWARALFLLLAAMTVVAWYIRFSGMVRRGRRRMKFGVLLILLGVLPAIVEPLMWFSESWAGLLIALSLALRTADRWWPSVVIGLVAVCFRELAVPYLVLMGLLALYERQRWEMVGWGVAILAFGFVVFVHAQSVQALTQMTDLASPGWFGRGGWALFLSSAGELTTLAALPPWIVALLLPLSLFGLAAGKSPIALRTLVTIVAYAVLIALFARPANIYWVWLISPILILGLLFIDTALSDLFRSLMRRKFTSPPPSMASPPGP